jgi:XTP/dITP diphosphohydrolase
LKPAPTSIRLLVATTNLDKLKEIEAVLADLPIELATLNDFPAVTIADETGSTFLENARQKALHYAAAVPGLLTMAEDSGFEVDALNGAPGIYSARYLQPDATYPERFAAIYDAVQQSGVATRAARFICAVVLASGRDILFETQRRVEGELAPAARGSGGFGYDPIFFYPPYQTTFGDVSAERKLAASHRGQAMRALKSYLESNM